MSEIELNEVNENESVEKEPIEAELTEQQGEIEEAAETTTDLNDEQKPVEEAVPEESVPEEPQVKKIKVRSAKPKEPKPKSEENAEDKPVKKATRKKAKEKEVIYKPKPKEVQEDEYDESYIPGSRKKWYVLKVQVNREEAIRDSLKRRYNIAGLEVYFGDILIPTEKLTEVRSGKKKIVKKKLYPGYLMINMEVTEETWFLVRDTPGIGDFTGAVGRPTPMLEHEIQAMLHQDADTEEDAPKLKINFQVGDKIKVKDGTFENTEGEVHHIDAGSGRVTVMISIFGRSAPVELEYWQIEAPEN